MSMSMGEIARQKIEAAERGEEYTPEDAGIGEVADDPEKVIEEREEAQEPVVEPTEPTEQEEEAAEEAADEAAEALGEDATEEEREQARQAARDEFYAGTYRTREEAEKGIAEKDETLKRLFSEKNTLEQRLAAVEAERAQQARELDTPEWEQWAQEQVASGAGEAGAMTALEHGGYDGYQIYLRHWMNATDEDGNPDADARAEALLYNNEVVMSIAEVRAAAAAERQRQQPSAQDEIGEAAALAKARYPDLDEYADKMAEVVTTLPDDDIQFLRRLAEQGVQGKAKATEILYLQARAMSQSTDNAKQVERRRRKASADAATLAATSLTAEGTAARTPPPATEQAALDRKRGLRERQNLPPLDE